jgi:hypothetical protein
MVIALFIDITLNPVAHRPWFQPGIVFRLKNPACAGRWRCSDCASRPARRSEVAPAR